MNRCFHNFVVLLIVLFSVSNTCLLAQILPYQDPSLPVEERVNDLMSRMSLDEKIGQMMQANLDAVESSKSVITNYFIGSILSGGDADPSDNLPATWANTYDDLQNYALATPLKIPMIYGIDAVHGHNNVYGATIFPHNIGLGCTRNPELIEEAARITAIDIAATGIDWTFGPCIAVPRDERWGRTYEGFGETPELAQMGAVQVHGFQGDSLSGGTSILATPKHYLGDGGTEGGIDRGNTIADETTIRNIFLPGYITALGLNAGSIMPSFSSINGEKMHGNRYWLTDVLKTELDFEGFLISDWAAVDQLNNNYREAVKEAINAGLDMVMLPNRYADFQSVMRDLVGSGEISLDRVNDAVRRILTIKFKLALFERPYTDKTLLPLVGSDEHRNVARQCVRESLVLLKKKDGILPLPKTNTRILVAGSNADDIGNQCGGWTITWQGNDGNITTGTTVIDGLQMVAPGAQIDYSLTGDFTDADADYSIVIIGEEPYAEMQGDATDLNISRNDVELIKKMESYGHPVILILVSGRPMILEQVLHYCDVIVAAWLPGTEGDGIAEVLFGDYQPKGLLSHTWPKNMDQIPINIGDTNYNPLYAYGFGIITLDDSPIGSAPVFLSAIVKNDGQHIELTFNKAMSNPSSSTFNFTVYKNGNVLPENITASLKENDNTTFVLQFDSAIEQREVITIQYNSGNIQSADGGILQPFAQQDVYNWVRPAAVVIPARIEAENFSEMLGVDIIPTTDIDGISQLINIDNGDWSEYFVSVPTGGYYFLKLRISSESIAGKITLMSGNTNIVSRNLPVTGSWTTWQTVQQVIGLTAGEHLLRLNADIGGFYLNWLAIESATSGIDTDNSVPGEFALYQNYPNPFNPTTTIEFSIAAVETPYMASLQHVSLKIYDVLGREVAILVNEEKPAGVYTVSFDGSNLSSGVYFYKLQAGEFVSIKKLILLK
ncbi:MAG: glycoside hydrolase family 3 N-terminal domain-containing protein [bacterium]